jgi:hypothetical protein
MHNNDNQDTTQPLLPRDEDKPYNPAGDAAPPSGEEETDPEMIDDTHPSTDSEVDAQELYDEGLTETIETTETTTEMLEDETEEEE